MPAKKEIEIPADKLLLFDRLIATNPSLERKGKTVPYTSHNGHMFTFLSSDGVLALRLPEAEREAFLKKYKTKLVEAYGIVMKEYVEVPDKLLEKTDALRAYLEMSYAYIKTLKAKPTTKKKK